MVFLLKHILLFNNNAATPFHDYTLKMLLQFTTTRRHSSMMLLDLHEIKRMKIIQVKRAIDWIYRC